VMYNGMPRHGWNAAAPASLQRRPVRPISPRHVQGSRKKQPRRARNEIPRLGKFQLQFLRPVQVLFPGQKLENFYNCRCETVGAHCESSPSCREARELGSQALRVSPDPSRKLRAPRRWYGTRRSTVGPHYITAAGPCLPSFGGSRDMAAKLCAAARSGHSPTPTPARQRLTWPRPASAAECRE
jgi:hypothetical protein